MGSFPAPECGPDQVIISGTLDGEPVELARDQIADFYTFKAAPGFPGSVEFELGAERILIEWKGDVGVEGTFGARVLVDLEELWLSNCWDDGYPSTLRWEDAEERRGQFEISDARPDPPCMNPAPEMSLAGCFDGLP